MGNSMIRVTGDTEGNRRQQGVTGGNKGVTRGNMGNSMIRVTGDTEGNRRQQGVTGGNIMIRVRRE